MTTTKRSVDMVTWAGHSVDFMHPEDTIVDWKDIEVHTRNICRYNGALDWKLQQHLALCIGLARTTHVRFKGGFQFSHDDTKLQAGYCGTHDFQEIYCTDVVSGLKKYLPAYTKIENAWEAYVHEQIGLPLSARNNEFVRYIDLRALVVEMTMLEHPATGLVAERYGGEVTPSERTAFKGVANNSPASNWSTINNAHKLAQQIYLKNEGLKVEIY